MPQPPLTPEGATCLRRGISGCPRASREHLGRLTGPGKTGEPAPGALLTQEADREAQSWEEGKRPQEHVLQKLGIRLAPSTFFFASESPWRASVGAKGEHLKEAHPDLGSALTLVDDTMGHCTADTARGDVPATRGHYCEDLVRWLLCRKLSAQARV